MQDKRLPFSEWAHVYVRITKSTKRPSASTMRRWYREGLKSGLRLEVTYMVGGVHTTESALRLFCELRDIESRPKAKPRIVIKQRIAQCDTETAMAKLEAMGI